MKNPIVSIIVPCYNQARYLPEALQSVLDQTYIDWECVIVNDGSPDDTDIVAHNWVIKDPRFRYVFQENRGLSSARNEGIKKAIGEFILPLDADDKISNDYLQLGMQAFLEDNDLKLVYARAGMFGELNKEWILKPFTLKNLSLANMIFCSAIYRKKDWDKVGGYDENMVHGYEDWEFWISILKKGGTVLKLDKICFYYRTKEQSMFVSISKIQHKQLYDYVCRKHIDLYILLFDNYPTFYNQFEEFKNKQKNILLSKKFVVNLFCKTFFKFQPFGKIKIR